MRSACLLGRDHHELGAVEAISEGRAAIALSMGGARKTYSYTDPNEDAAAFLLGPRGAFVAVADGHRGAEGAEAAIGHLLEHPAEQWVGPSGPSAQAWPRHVLAALCDANAAILAAGRERGVPDGSGAGPRTTLSLAVARPADDLLLIATVGDSHLFRIDEGICDLAQDAVAQTHFLGHEPETPESLAKKCQIDALPLAGTRALVLASDGLSEKHVGVADPAAAVLAAVRRAWSAPADVRALQTARDVVETALEAHRHNPSGDNAASAVLWLD